MNLAGGGQQLLERALRGEKLSRRERKDVDLYLHWRIAFELEHICAAIRGVEPDGSEEALAALRYADEVED